MNTGRMTAESRDLTIVVCLLHLLAEKGEAEGVGGTSLPRSQLCQRRMATCRLHLGLLGVETASGVKVDGLSKAIPTTEEDRPPICTHTFPRRGHRSRLPARRIADGTQQCFSKTRKMTFHNRLKWEDRGERAGRGGGHGLLV